MEVMRQKIERKSAEPVQPVACAALYFLLHFSF